MEKGRGGVEYYVGCMQGMKGKKVKFGMAVQPPPANL
jgi:hypothetical protein